MTQTQSKTQVRIFLDVPIQWSFFSKPRGQRTQGMLINLSDRQALLETFENIPTGRWLRLRLKIDASFELMVIGRVAQSHAGARAGTHFHLLDLTQQVNPVILALIRLRKRMTGKNDPQRYSGAAPTPA